MLLKIGADNSGLKSSLKDSQASIKSAFSADPVEDFTNALSGTASGIESLISKFSGLAAVAAGGFGIAALVDNAVSAGNAAYEMSQRLGVSSAEAINLGRVLSLSGADAGSFNSAMMRLDKSFSATGTSGKLCRDTLAATGVTLTDTNGKLLPVTEQLTNMAAGYDKAKQSGQQQAFLMNTLGVKGLQLTKVFEDYNEKMKIASETQGIGLNPEEMHKLSLEMDSVKMQASQVGLVFGSALAPIAEELFPPILTGLKSTAKYLAENKTGTIAITEEIMKLYLAYKAVSMVKSAIGTVKNIAQGFTSNAGEKASAEDLSISQQKSIEKAVKASEAGYLRKTNAAVKSAQAESENADEAAAKIAAAMEQIVAESEAASMAIRERMTAAFTGAAASAEESAIAINTAIESTGTTAVEAAEVKTAVTVESAEACTAVVVESSAAQVEAIAATGEAAEEAALVKTAVTEESAAACTEATESSSIAQTESMGAVGVAAELAGEQAVTANNSAVVAANELTLAEGRVAEAEVVAGNTAVETGAKTETACASAAVEVGVLSGAVALLQANWLLVAYAAYEALKYMDKAANSKYKMQGYDKDSNVRRFKSGVEGVPDTWQVQTEDGSWRDFTSDEMERQNKYNAGEDPESMGPPSMSGAGAGIVLPTAQSEATPKTGRKAAAPKESDEDKAADKARHKEIEDANKFVEQMNKTYDGMYVDEETNSKKAYQIQLDNLKKWHDDGLISQQDYDADMKKLAAINTVNMIVEQQKQADAERGYQKSAIELAQSLQNLKDANLTGSAAAAATFQKEWDDALKNVKTQVDDLVSKLNSIKNPDERNKNIKGYQDRGLMKPGDFTGKAVTADDLAPYASQAITAVNTNEKQKQQDDAYKNWRTQLDLEYNHGNIQAYQQMLDQKQNLDQNYKDSQKKYMDEIDTLWHQSNTNIYDDYASMLQSVDSSFDKTIENFAEGKTTSENLFKDLVQSILDGIIKIEAQKAAAGLTSSLSSILGISSTASTSSGTSGTANISPFISLASTAFAAGGIVSGAGTGTSDSIHAMLSDGEYVMTADATKAIGIDTLDQLNGYASGGLVTRSLRGYAAGGLVTGPSLASLSYGSTNAALVGSGSTGIAAVRQAPIVNVMNNTGTSVQSSNVTMTQDDMGQQVFSLVLDHVASNGSSANSLSQALGSWK